MCVVFPFLPPAKMLGSGCTSLGCNNPDDSIPSTLSSGKEDKAHSYDVTSVKMIYEFTFVMNNLSDDIL